MKVINPIYDKTGPVKAFKSKKLVPRKPWATEEIIDQLELRYQIYKTYLNSKSDESYFIYKIKESSE